MQPYRGFLLVNMLEPKSEVTCLGFGEIAYPSVNSTFEKMDLGEDHLVVEPLKLR